MFTNWNEVWTSFQKNNLKKKTKKKEKEKPQTPPHPNQASHCGSDPRGKPI